MSGNCNSVETAQPGDRTTNPGIVLPERYVSSQRVDSLARVVITPVRHTHTRLHNQAWFTKNRACETKQCPIGGHFAFDHILIFQGAFSPETSHFVL